LQGSLSQGCSFVVVRSLDRVLTVGVQGGADVTEETKYHVFLSYSSADRDAVEAVARRLEDASLNPFLDHWHLIPGQPFQEALEEALEQSETMAVFVGPSGISSWHREEMRAGLDRAVRSRDDVRAIPVLLPGAQPKDLPAFLSRRTYVDFRAGLDDDDAFARLVAGVLGQPPEQAGAFSLPDEPVPYPGLRPFEAQQAGFFFGRTAECHGLLERLCASSFVAVLGASGSGKSSLVLAGLVPNLDEGWHALILAPGPWPLRALADQLATLSRSTGRLQLADDLQVRLAERTDGLSTAVSTLLADRPDIATLLIVVDQFEELFTQVAGAPEEVRQQQCQFIANLVDMVQALGGRARLVLTLRADFVQHCLEFAGLCALLESNQLLLGPMGAGALREAIVKPAQMVGAMFEKGLVGRLMEDMHRQPTALPLMQSALAQLWQRRHGVWLTHAAYEAIGGVSGAIDQRAEAVYGRLSEKHKRLARNLFVRLVAFGEDTSDTRRRVHREELDLVGTAAEDVEKLIGILSHGDVRLIATGADAIELAHEALIEQWGRLRCWLKEDRATLRIHRQLTRASQEWERLDCDGSYLYRGSRLSQVERWTETRTADLSTLEHDFIRASVAAQRAELATRRQRRVLRVAVFGLSVLVLIALVALLWMFCTGTELFRPTGSWVHLGDLETEVNAIAVDPMVPDIIYAGTRDSQVFKSPDKGQNWTQVLTTGPETWIMNVTLAPHTVGTLYVGTDAGTLFRSSDSGDHWTDLGTVSGASGVTYLAVDPLAPGTLYVSDAEHPYIYKSIDNGTSWVTITVALDGQAISALTTGVMDKAISVLYAGGEDGYLWRSMDQGASWQSDLLESPLQQYVVDIVVNPADANVLYALTTDGLYRIQADTVHVQAQPLVDGLEGEKVAVDPHSPGVLFVSVTSGNVYVVQDREDGARYQLIASEEEFTHSGWTPWLVASDRAPYFLYAATEKGVFGWLPSPQMAAWVD
jgi:energy-coupling factor transporter ATP-binding protein EcfA2